MAVPVAMSATGVIIVQIRIFPIIALTFLLMPLDAFSRKPPVKTKQQAALKKPDESSKEQDKYRLRASDTGISPEEAEREAVADKKRDEQMAAAKKILPKINDRNPQKADLLFQLSELYWEKSRYLYKQEMHAFFDAQKKAEKLLQQGTKVPEPKEDHRQSESYRKETMQLYKRILKDYPRYERADEVLFNFAYNLYEIEQRNRAIQYYEQLLKEYPNSALVADTYVQLGNHYFEVANILERAYYYYRKAYNTEKPRIRSYALYKLAWCDYNAGILEAALDKLQKTVLLSEREGQAGNLLKNEALRDLVRIFAELNRLDEAIAYYYVHASKKKLNSYISRFAYALQTAGYHENAIKAFRHVLKKDPLSATAPDLQQNVITSYEKLGQREQVRAEVKKLATLYRPGSDWWQANAAKKTVLRSGFNVAEEAMRTLVVGYHQEAQNTKKVRTYQLARDIYKEYLTGFASSHDETFIADQAFNLKFYYAEILWALEEWEVAGAQYLGVVHFRIPNRPDAQEVSNEQYRKAAAYNAILAYDKLVKLERGLIQKVELAAEDRIDEKKKKRKIRKKRKLARRSMKELQKKLLTNFEMHLIASCDTYRLLFSKADDAIDMAYQAAIIYHDSNHFVEAARRLGEIVNNYPTEKRSRQAADLSMAILEEKNQWLELNILARQFLANKKLTKPKSAFEKHVRTIVEGSQYKYIDEVVYKKDKNPSRASRLFLAFVKEFPQSDNADRALTYAMIIAREAYELDKAALLGERFLTEYPQSIFDLKVKATLASLYEKMANFEKSADMYKEFVMTYDIAAGSNAIGYANIEKRYKTEEYQSEVIASKITTVSMKKLPEDKRKQREAQIAEASAIVADAQYNIGFWYEGVGQFDKAITGYKNYIARFKDKQDVVDIAFNIGLVLEKQSLNAQAIRYYQNYLEEYAQDKRLSDSRRFDVLYRQFLLHATLQNFDEQTRMAKQIVSKFQKLKNDEKNNYRSKLAFAHAQFYLIEPQWNEYSAQRFNYENFSRSKILAFSKVDLPKKEKTLNTIKDAYTELVAIGNPEYAIAALTRIGMAYGDFANNIASIPDPQGFDEDQVQIFRSELENRYVFPVEEKAIDVLETALAKSYELSVYNQWTLKAQNHLNTYKPGLYSKPLTVSYRSAESFVRHSLQKNVQLPAATIPVVPATTTPVEQKPAEQKPAEQKPVALHRRKPPLQPSEASAN